MRPFAAFTGQNGTPVHVDADSVTAIVEESDGVVAVFVGETPFLVRGTSHDVLAALDVEPKKWKPTQSVGPSTTVRMAE